METAIAMEELRINKEATIAYLKTINDKLTEYCYQMGACKSCPFCDLCVFIPNVLNYLNHCYLP